MTTNGRVKWRLAASGAACLAAAACLSLLAGCVMSDMGTSHVCPIDRAIIHHHCRQTIERAAEVQDDGNCPMYVRDEWKLLGIRAEALDEWARTGRFPIGARR